jgi:GNAT superfamily N-acetyltransferase
VLVQEGAAGLIALESEPGYLWLVKLYLRSEFRGKGIGTELLLGVLSQAQHVGKRVRLRVLRVNTKAQALYLRHGFKVVEETQERFFMETSASGA